MFKRHLYIVIVLFLPLTFGCASMRSKEVPRPALTFMSISELPEGFEKDLVQKVATRNVYIIVHPSYYLFFGKNNPLPALAPGKNVVTTFLETDQIERRPFIDLMKYYERTEIEFLSSSSPKGKLIILVMPGKYLSSKLYLYRDGKDEYARYLNEVINGDNAVFYVESIRSSSGRMSKKERHALKNFLRKVKAQNIYVGGGYVGRCQKEVYKVMSRMWPDNRLAIIPDLSSFSPRDVSDSTAKMLLTDNLELNNWSATYYIKNGILKDFEVNLRNLPVAGSEASMDQDDAYYAFPANEDINEEVDLSAEHDDPGIEDYPFNAGDKDGDNSNDKQRQ